MRHWPCGTGSLRTDAGSIERGSLAGTGDHVMVAAMSILKLRYRPEDEWHGELLATVQSAEFSGRGAAWFGIGQLREFCENMERFPIPEGEGPELRGGFFNDAGDTLDQCHLGVTITPYGHLGRLRVAVELATPVWKSAEQELRHKMYAEFPVNYSDLETFRLSLIGMLDGQRQEALLQATPT